MRIHRIEKQQTPTSDWEHVAWVEKSAPIHVERELDKYRVSQTTVYCWRVVPYRMMEDDIKYFLKRI